ncbi:hypothetical protein EHI8A_182680 [Entamoeba histolytica HM-1:IMSS-B]|uniref:C2 domain-containing protein n=5 Tax=Entamoeba histolytica TaxID=5759 RepID=C4M9K8_ENTH1|nr:hypothetical protein EHI_189170 [Entamoeba histolytica HM-1:IMSS]EMD45224.1 C2 domain containing protein [Entamoeba histolytica KU27]EMH76214.1 hypothetical protein EHI8A_182680 [Entamoeba histolytica HM-1:IMSS-B]ENY61412.1 hypothetical protein EHI7A_161920 [Entamoeba histolytica HM-1:IMSS-A]GAT98360.1 hypothetical protein CL6EHI_189170 [Entamoeba histolytica]EAL43926.1 hypothetical protein EHI_189170 [Entamoeba histolytica HM-1:IMSS]|eukprot:XP_649316.1 hypothetical protein EHI_189170 [Entamoeba histolytica HM-1:IMSS]
MQIELNIFCAKNVEIGDVYTSDPYVVFTSEGKKLKTQIIDCTLDPIWNKKFDVKYNIGEVVVFEVFDHDTVGSDDPLGKAEWKVPAMNNGETTYHILKIDVKGYLYIIAKCISGGCQITRQMIDPNAKMLLELKFNKLYGLLDSFYKISKKVSSKGYQFTVSVKSNSTDIQTLVPITPSGKTDCTNTLLNQILYVETTVGDQIQFEVFAKPSRDKSYSLGTTTFEVPDLFETESIEYLAPILPSGVIDVNITCLRSIYWNLNTSLIPKNVSYQGKYLLTILSASDLSLMGQKKFYPYCSFTLNGSVYSTYYVDCPKEVVIFNQSYLITYQEGAFCDLEILNKNPALFSREGAIVGKGKFRLSNVEIKSTLNISLDDGGRVSILLQRLRSINPDYYNIPVGIEQIPLQPCINNPPPQYIEQPVGNVPIQSESNGFEIPSIEGISLEVENPSNPSKPKKNFCVETPKSKYQLNYKCGYIPLTHQQGYVVGMEPMKYKDFAALQPSPQQLAQLKVQQESNNQNISNFPGQMPFSTRQQLPPQIPSQPIPQEIGYNPLPSTGPLSSYQMINNQQPPLSGIDQTIPPVPQRSYEQQPIPQNFESAQPPCSSQIPYQVNQQTNETYSQPPQLPVRNQPPQLSPRSQQNSQAPPQLPPRGQQNTQVPPQLPPRGQQNTQVPPQLPPRSQQQPNYGINPQMQQPQYIPPNGYTPNQPGYNPYQQVPRNQYNNPMNQPPQQYGYAPQQGFNQPYHH